MAKRGRPVGTKTPATLNKEMAREALRAIVMREMDALVSAQVANAKGLNYLVARNAKTGKFERVTTAMLDNPDQYPENVEVWEKDPSVQAFTDLMNRTIDKPAEHVEMTGADKGPIVFKWQE